MIDKERIKFEADAFFDWPTQDKTYVSTVSMLIFTNVIAEMARSEEREACAKICEENDMSWADDVWNSAVKDCATKIRTRSNVELTGADPAGEASE